MNAKIKLFRFKKNDNFVLSKKANNTRYYKELFPAVRCIFCAEPRHKRMSLPSGLEHSFSKERSSFFDLFGRNDISISTNIGSLLRGVSCVISPYVEMTSWRKN
jgi:hypothetical protein